MNQLKKITLLIPLFSCVLYSPIFSMEKKKNNEKKTTEKIVVTKIAAPYEYEEEGKIDAILNSSKEVIEDGIEYLKLDGKDEISQNTFAHEINTCIKTGIPFIIAALTIQTIPDKNKPEEKINKRDFFTLSINRWLMNPETFARLEDRSHPATREEISYPIQYFLFNPKKNSFDYLCNERDLKKTSLIHKDIRELFSLYDKSNQSPNDLALISGHVAKLLVLQGNIKLAQYFSTQFNRHSAMNKFIIKAEEDIEKEDYTSAIEWYTVAEEMGTLDAYSMYTLGQLYDVFKKDYDKAIKYYEKSFDSAKVSIDVD